MKNKIYRVQGSFWKQGELMYADQLEVWKMLKGKIEGFSFTPSFLAAVLDQMEADGAIPKLFDHILKPHEPTFFHRWRNRRAWRKMGYDGQAPVISFMTVDQIARVAMDFFLLNGSWLVKLLNLPLESRWHFRPRLRVRDMLSTLTNSYILLRGETYLQRNGSGVSLPQK